MNEHASQEVSREWWGNVCMGHFFQVFHISQSFWVFWVFWMSLLSPHVFPFLSTKNDGACLQQTPCSFILWCLLTMLLAYIISSIATATTQLQSTTIQPLQFCSVYTIHPYYCYNLLLHFIKSLRVIPVSLMTH